MLPELEAGEPVVRDGAWSLLGVVASAAATPGPSLLRLDAAAVHNSATLDVALSAGAAGREGPAFEAVGGSSQLSGEREGSR